MRKRTLIGIAGLALIITGIAGVTMANAGAASPTKLTVAMRDPGCHWFFLANQHKYVKAVTRTGPVALANNDESSLKVRGPGGTKIDRLGANLTLKAKGVYTITMVGQPPDDNTLKLTIK